MLYQGQSVLEATQAVLMSEGPLTYFTFSWGGQGDAGADTRLGYHIGQDRLCYCLLLSVDAKFSGRLVIVYIHVSPHTSQVGFMGSQRKNRMQVWWGGGALHRCSFTGYPSPPPGAPLGQRGPSASTDSILCHGFDSVGESHWPGQPFWPRPQPPPPREGE